MNSVDKSETHIRANSIRPLVFESKTIWPKIGSYDDTIFARGGEGFTGTRCHHGFLLMFETPTFSPQCYRCSDDNNSENQLHPSGQRVDSNTLTISS